MKRLRFGGFLFLFLVFGLGETRALAADPARLPVQSTVEAVTRQIEDDQEEAVETKKPFEEPPVDSDLIQIQADDTRPFFLKKINLISEVNSFEEDDLDAIFSKYENREILITDLFKAMQEVEQLFRSKGLLVVVYIPPQRAMDGEIILRTRAATMGKLVVEGNRYTPERLLKSYWDIEKGDMIDYFEMRSSLYRMNRNPDRVVRSILKAGEAKGETDVFLKVDDKRPFHFLHSYDNHGVKLTGQHRQTFMAQHTNVTGHDDSFYAGGVYGRSFGAAFLNYDIPINRAGTSFMSSVNYAQVNPKKEFAEFGINSISNSLSFGLKHDIVRSYDAFAEAYVQFDVKEKRTRVLSEITSWDRLRILSSGIQFQGLDESGTWLFGQDIKVALPWTKERRALRSRTAPEDFFVYLSRIERRQNLLEGLVASIEVEAQLTQDRVSPSEQFFLGGISTVRGYGESDFSSDRGVVIRSELEKSLPDLSFGQAFFSEGPLRLHQGRFYGFYDFGYGRVLEPDFERESRTLMGAGVGLTFSVGSFTTVDIEFAMPIHEEPLSEGGETHLYTRVSNRF